MNIFWMYSPIMKEHMQYIIDHAEEIEKLLKVKAQVSEVKSIMLENIDKVRQIRASIGCDPIFYPLYIEEYIIFILFGLSS